MQPSGGFYFPKPAKKVIQARLLITGLSQSLPEKLNRLLLVLALLNLG
jgi:hypothetical protein